VAKPAATKKAAGRKLKVFRTAIGFHDALVAAPSRKAALAAWGAGADIFAQGLAEEVSDPELVKLALAQPGEVVRVARGSAAEHVEALGKASNGVKSKARSPAKSEPKRAPRPSRAKVDAAEAALREAEERFAAEIEAIREEERKLEAKREKLAEAQRKEREMLQAKVDAEQHRYSSAITEWANDN
jgi:hypothetical protein